MMRYLIIDDEPIAHGIIEDYAAALINLQKVGNCYNALEALTILQREQIDLIFLDINMPKLSGFDMLKTLSSKPKVIVTSAYQEYALEGYEMEVTDYLLKPFSLERFLRAVNKASEPKGMATQSAKETPELSTIFIKEDRRSRQTPLASIHLIEAYGNYCKVHLADETILTPEKISHFEQILPSDLFLRVHKSFMVSRRHIMAIEGTKINILDRYIPVGQTYASAVKKILGH